MILNGLDYAMLVIVGLSVLTGLFRGFVKELIALCVWVVAIWLAMTYSGSLDGVLSSYIHDKTARYVVAFVLILLTSVIVGGLFNALLSFILRRTGLSGIDRLLGMLFGFFRGVFMVALFLLVVSISGFSIQEYTDSSCFYPKVEPLVQWMSGYMPDMVNHVKQLDQKVLPQNIIPAV
jgi:membrane protein required for colicin V production